MSETTVTDHQTPEPEPVPQAPAALAPAPELATTVEAEAEAETETEAAAAPRRKAGPALRIGAAVVAAALLGVGIGVGILKTEYDDPAPVAAPAPAATATAPAGPSYGAKSNGTHFGSMRDLLVPMPAGYSLGPDSGAYGNDTELTADQRTAWIEDDIRSLPQKMQDAIRKDWQQYQLKGAGIRSYVAPGQDFTVTMWLLQYHQDAVKADNTWVGVLSSDSGLFRIGPDVPGHADAHCYLPFAEPGVKIDRLICSAAVGDLRVEMRVEGVAPLPKDQAVTIFNQQLDRLALPGAST
ncbi:hypothetical protein GCM10009760_10740 [Kitasatospora kazusensis]|uniref:Uncharacterized protein n=1 Tax=Kitasatospora kazusensis TaxID=407974 RepID=A0ABP5KKU4_9ACTN